MSTAAPGAATPAEPFLAVVKGSPSDTELAALVVVLNAARASGGPAPDAKPLDRWGAPEDRLRPDLGMPGSYLNRG